MADASSFALSHCSCINPTASDSSSICSTIDAPPSCFHCVWREGKRGERGGSIVNGFQLSKHSITEKQRAFLPLQIKSITTTRTSTCRGSFTSFRHNMFRAQGVWYMYDMYIWRKFQELHELTKFPVMMMLGFQENNNDKQFKNT